jgi:HAD superfamily hydrolase (TIGR01509 family)
MWNDIDGALLAEHGVTYKGEHKHAVLGTSFQRALQFYKDTFNIRAEVEELLIRRREIALDFYATKIPMFEAAPNVLAELKAMDLRLGLATSSVSHVVLPFLERHDIKKYFAALTTGEEVERGKPDPDIYLKAAGKVGVAPEKCLVIEDALSGVQAGKSAGMTVVAIPDPRFMDVTLYPERADVVIGELGELLGWVRENL